MGWGSSTKFAVFGKAEFEYNEVATKYYAYLTLLNLNEGFPNFGDVFDTPFL